MDTQPAEPRTPSEAPAPDPMPEAWPISEASALPPGPAPITPVEPAETPTSPLPEHWLAPPTGAPPVERPDMPLKLWSGWEVGWIAFLLGFPGGLALAARNWFRMGRRHWAAGHLLAGAVGFALFVALPDNIVRGLALLLNIGLAFYLYRQTESDIAVLEASDRPIETASWVSGIATSLAATALLVGVVVVPLAFSGVVDIAPASNLGTELERAEKLLADGQEEEAIAAFTAILDANPGSRAALEGRGCARGMVETDPPEAALADLDRAIELGADGERVHRCRAIALGDVGDFEGALTEAETAVELGPDEPFAHVALGSVLDRLGRGEEAIAAHDRAIELAPELADAYTNRGAARSRAGDDEGALADFNRAIELDPENALAYANRSLMSLAAGDSEGALADAEKAIELEPTLAFAYAMRALCRVDADDLIGGWEDATTAIELGPNDWFSYYVRGFIAVWRGDRLAAKLDLEKAIDLTASAEEAEAIRAVADENGIALE